MTSETNSQTPPFENTHGFREYIRVNPLKKWGTDRGLFEAYADYAGWQCLKNHYGAYYWRGIASYYLVDCHITAFFTKDKKKLSKELIRLVSGESVQARRTAFETLAALTFSSDENAAVETETGTEAGADPTEDQNPEALREQLYRALMAKTLSEELAVEMAMTIESGEMADYIRKLPDVGDVIDAVLRQDTITIPDIDPLSLKNSELKYYLEMCRGKTFKEDSSLLKDNSNIDIKKNPVNFERAAQKLWDKFSWYQSHFSLPFYFATKLRRLQMRVDKKLER